MSSLLLLFAIVESVVSFVLPIIDAFGTPHSFMHMFYLEVFKLIQIGISILALAYLQSLVFYYKRQKKSDKLEMTELVPSKALNAVETGQPHTLIQSSNCLFEEKKLDFIEVDSSPKISSSSNQSQRYECGRNADHNYVNTGREISVDEIQSIVQKGKDDGENVRIIEEIDSQQQILSSDVKRHVTVIGRVFGDHMSLDRSINPPFIETAHGSNLYLRLGAVVFGCGVMIMDGFRVADQFDSSNSAMKCHSVLWVPVNLVHSIYIFWQTYFLFKHHRVIFNVQKFFVRFLLAHMTVVNLGQWLSTVVQEVMVSENGESITTKRNVRHGLQPTRTI